jgi:hypothetical protein
MKSLFLSLICLAVVCNAQSWVGTWTDTEYGGNAFICVSDSAWYMAYSEAGIAVGTISGNTVRGNWYEGGGDTLPDPTSGSFTITLAADGNSFSGIYTFQGDNEG